MKDTMSRSRKPWLILVILVVVALLSGVWATFFIPPPPIVFPADLLIYRNIKVVIAVVNTTILAILFVTYVSIYRKTKSEFTIGLMIFSGILLLQSITGNPMIYRMFGFLALGLGPFIMLPDLFLFIALSVLLYLTIKY